MPAQLRVLVFCSAFALLALMPVRSLAYVVNGYRWPQTPVPYFLNPTNLDGRPIPIVEAAIKTGADTWQAQSGAAVGFLYAGLSSQNVVSLDSTNLVMFRNESSGSAIATTYTWMSNSDLVEADIVFWDAGFTFYTGTTGCAGGFYIEDIAAHEFGHALGLGHSTVATATMYPSTPPCNTSLRTLDPDDIAGIHRCTRPFRPLPLRPQGCASSSSRCVSSHW